MLTKDAFIWSNLVLLIKNVKNAKMNFQQPSIQSSASPDPSEITDMMTLLSMLQTSVPLNN